MPSRFERGKRCAQAEPEAVAIGGDAFDIEAMLGLQILAERFCRLAGMLQDVGNPIGVLNGILAPG